jgi:hypothetical protein
MCLLFQAFSFRVSAEKMFTPLAALSIYAEMYPDVNTVKRNFPIMADKLLEEVRATEQLLYPGNLCKRQE